MGQIFGTVYPASFSNWYADPWLCDIYQPFSSFFHASDAGAIANIATLLVIDRQPFRYLRKATIPDGWFDYPDSTNIARRKIRTWLLAHTTDAVVVQCPAGYTFCRPVPVIALESRWCLSPRDGLFFSRGGKHQLDCSITDWHPVLECWRSNAATLLVENNRHDSSAHHVGRVCRQQELDHLRSTEMQSLATMHTQLMEYKIPDGARVGEQLRVTISEGKTIHFTVPIGVTPGQIVSLKWS